MKLSVSRPAVPRLGAPTRLGLLLFAAGLLLGVPASSQEKPNLKDVLGRVQTEAETKAVEDLVGKLKGVSRQPAVSPPGAPPGGPAPSATPAAADPGRSDTGPTAVTPPDRMATPAPVTPTTQQPQAGPMPTPEEAVKRAETKQAPSVDMEVFFEYDSAAITQQAEPTLTTLGRALRDAQLADDAFLIAGHTDAKGGYEYNRDLSQRRAESVRQFLIANFGIDASKLVARGFAYKHLKNPKQPRAAENRRVQIVNMSKDVARDGRR